MLKTDATSPRSRVLDPLRTLGSLALGDNSSRATLALRTGVLLLGVLAIDLLIDATGGLPSFYTGLYFVLLMYAGLFLPLPLAIGVTLIAAAGPTQNDLLFLDFIEKGSFGIVSRPLAMGGVMLFSAFIARTIRRNLANLRRAEAAIRQSEQRTFSFLDSMPVGVFILDGEGRAYYANKLAIRLLGRGIEPGAAANNLSEVYSAFRAGTDEIYPDDLTPIVRALDGKSTIIDDMELARHDGRMSLQVWGTPIQDEKGNVNYALAAFSDITAERRFEQALRESEERFRTIFEEGPLGIVIVSTEFRFLQVNQAFCDMVGYSGDELAELHFLDITHPDDKGIHLPSVDPLARGDIPVLEIEKRYVRKDGGVIWVRVSVRPIRDAQGRPEHYIAMVREVTDQHIARDEIEHLAYHDPLTGLPNRRLMLDRIDQAISRAKRHGGKFVLLSIDLDGFKRINDEHGHAAGDAFLVETSRRLEQAIRESDTVARMGGDEFLVLLTETTRADAEIVSGRITQSLARPVAYEGNTLFAAASVGSAICDDDVCDSDSLIRAADAAMYADKAKHPAAPR